MKDGESILRTWRPPARPEWLQRFLDETQSWEKPAVAPLESAELIETAQRNTGLHDFGSDDWREPFEILVKAIVEEADLHLFGRLWTRQDLILLLETRLNIEATYAAHPEIEDVVIDRPVFITGMPRSGTSILFELLAQDTQFLPAANWEFVLPCPPPEAATYRHDPRIAQAHDLITQAGRVAPTYQSMHEMGAWIPNECGVSMRLSFRSPHLTTHFQVPTYSKWLFSADQGPAYRYHKRLLKLLQWKNPRGAWLLKDPSHQSFLPTLFETFPDARVIVTHRDPVRAQGSVTNLIGTFYWMRSNQAFDAMAFEELLTPEGSAARLNRLIDWIESGTVPAERLFNSRYVDLMADPMGALEGLYGEIGMRFTQEARQKTQDYLDHKPKGKFGKHSYAVDRRDSTQALFARYQSYFDVPNED